MITMKVETISPQQAVEYLKHNTDNYRKLSMSKVYQYAEDMRKGRWVLNGETIVFDEDGCLKDGQHRLAGIARSGVSVQMTVVRGTAKDVKLYDVGMTRTAKQLLAAENFDATGAMIGAASLYLDQVKNPSRAQAVQYCKTHWSELKRAERTTLNGDNTAPRKASCVLAAYLMLRLNEMPYYELELFFQIFATKEIIGTDGYEPSPPLIARQQFDSKTTGGRRAQREQLDIIIQAMSDFHGKRRRDKRYIVSDPMSYETRIAALRKEDGLE